MDSTIDLVRQHCLSQLTAYGKCVEKDPSNFTSRCRLEKSDLSACAENKYVLIL